MNFANWMNTVLGSLIGLDIYTRRLGGIEVLFSILLSL